MIGNDLFWSSRNPRKLIRPYSSKRAKPGDLSEGVKGRFFDGSHVWAGAAIVRPTVHSLTWGGAPTNGESLGAVTGRMACSVSIVAPINRDRSDPALKSSIVKNCGRCISYRRRLQAERSGGTPHGRAVDRTVVEMKCLKSLLVLACPFVILGTKCVVGGQFIRRSAARLFSTR